MFREFSIRFVRNCTRKDFAVASELIGRDIGYDRLLNCILPLSECEKGFGPLQGAYKVIFEV